MGDVIQTLQSQCDRIKSVDFAYSENYDEKNDYSITLPLDGIRNSIAQIRRQQFGEFFSTILSMSNSRPFERDGDWTKKDFCFAQIRSG